MKKIMPIVIGIVVAIGLILILGQYQETSIAKSEAPTDSQYINANSLLIQALAERQIQMSSPIKISSPENIEKYCSLFASEEKQQLIKYCTSTEVKNQNGEFLGNIHMVGTLDTPQVVMALIQTDKDASQLDSAKNVFETVTESLICNCWSEQKPGGLNSIDSWVDGLWQFHQTDTKPHSKSNTLKLDGKSLQLELTTNNDGYLWKFLIYN